MGNRSPVRVCFVCLGNICRSPTAEGVMRKVVIDAGLAEHIAIDSAGTDAYHVGERPDGRATRAAKERGIHLEHRAQAFESEHFAKFDHVIAMDRKNHETLSRLAGSPADKAKIQLFRSFDSTASEGAEVPDPYYGGARGFEDVLDMTERASIGLLAHLRARYGI